jgi:hypothetical protein
VRALVRYRKNEFRPMLAAMRAGLCSVVPRTSSCARLLSRPAPSDPRRRAASVLDLLTWRELEEKVCGSAVIDIELLKRVAVYKARRLHPPLCAVLSARPVAAPQGFSPNDRSVQLFWKVLESWSSEFCSLTRARTLARSLAACPADSCVLTDALRVKFLRFVWARERLLRRADQFRQAFQITKDPNPRHYPTAQTWCARPVRAAPSLARECANGGHDPASSS